MLTDEAFRVWIQRNQIAPHTEAALARIRSSPPSRRVRGRASNVSGRYPSVKMGRSIQFESQHVELWAIYAMERDDDVLEYYDQPTRIQFHYTSRSGRKTSPWHTPDFLVIHRNGASFEEWKAADSLEPLATRMPERYQRDPRGGWRCPPGEAAAQALGLTYRVRTSSEYHPHYIQNLKFLQDFWTHPFTLSKQAESQVKEAVMLYPGISVAALLEAASGDRHKGNRIERAPGRDPVGESVNTELAEKCPGSGQVFLDLDVHRFTQSAVVHVQCLHCGSIRKGSLKKDQIVCPSHDKLRGRSTHTGPRWVKNGAEWKVVAGTKR